MMRHCGVVSVMLFCGDLGSPVWDNQGWYTDGLVCGMCRAAVFEHDNIELGLYICVAFCK